MGAIRWRRVRGFGVVQLRLGRKELSIIHGDKYEKERSRVGEM